MGTVKYSGPIASFHCPTEATIRSLKVHFSPKQEGSGDPSPENVRPIVGWDGVEVYSYPDVNISIDNIPNEYKKINYLQSSGTQYIDTLVSGGDNTTHPKYEIIFTPLNSTKTYQQYFAGLRSPQGVPKLYKNANITCVVEKVGVGTQNCNISYDKISKIVASEDLCEVNGIDIAFQSSVASTGWGSLSWYVFNSHAEPTLASNMRLYGLKMWSNESLIRNFIPCRRKSDNKPGMYDTVSGEFFTNQGTGEFICGPDVGQTISVAFPAKSSNLFDKTATRITSWSNIDQNEICYCTANLAGSNVDDQIRFSSSCHTLGLPISINDSVKIYFFNGFPSTPRFTWAICDNSGKLLEKHFYTANSSKPYDNFTASYDGYMFVEWCLNDDVATDGIVITKNELYEVTQYEAYNPDNTVYGGWVDLVSGEVCEEYGLLKINNTCEIVAPTSANEPWNHRWSIRQWNSNISKWFFKTSTNILYCDRLNKVASATKNGEIYGVTVEARVYLYDDEITTVEEFHTKYDGMELCAPVSEPYNTYHLAPTQLQTFLGQNNVWSNADYVEVEYDLHETQTLLQRKAFIIANQPHIVKPAAAPLQNFVTDMKAPLKSCKVYFNPVQEGTGDPSPDNVRPIMGWNGLSIAGQSKNLLDPQMSEYYNYTIGPTGGIVVSTNDRITTGFYSCGAGITVTASCHSLWYYSASEFFSFAGIAAYNKNKEFITRAFVNSAHSVTLTTPQDTAFIRFFMQANNRANPTPQIFNSMKIQLELGSTATVYEPYSGTTIPVDWTTEAGTIYGGYVDPVSGEVWKTWSVVKLKDYVWNRYTGYQFYLTFTHRDKTSTEVISDTFPVSNSNGYPKVDKTIGFYSGGQSYANIIFIRYNNSDNANDFNAWLQSLENNPVVVYKLATPVLVTTLTPQQLSTLRGTNNIWSNSNGDITVQFWKH